MSEKESFRAGYVAIIGRPNAGKSTLLNRLLGQRLAIVTPKPQTTRHRVLGILNGNGYQMLLLDTPGILDPKYVLQEMMKKEIQKALADADVILLLIDATEPVYEDLMIFEPEKGAIAINKIDAIPKKNLLPIAERCAKAGFDKIFMISALTGEGVEDLKNGLIELLPQAPPFYPLNTISDRPERFFVAEL
ncbi:MAG: GTPase Era, partial [candidate division WOR-3 bacterium]